MNKANFALGGYQKEALFTFALLSRKSNIVMDHFIS